MKWWHRFLPWRCFLWVQRAPGRYMLYNPFMASWCAVDGQRYAQSYCGAWAAIMALEAKRKQQ